MAQFDSLSWPFGCAISLLSIIVLLMFVSCFILGRGVVTLRERPKGSFLLQYKGELVDGKEGEKREQEREPSGFRYFFQSHGKMMW